MSVTINCNFARVHVRELAAKHGKPKQKLSTDNLKAMHTEFTTQFQGNENFKLSFAVARKRFVDINKAFNRPWANKSDRTAYETAFSSSVWKDLTSESQSKHTLRDCSACQQEYGSLSSLFPAKDAKTVAQTMTAKENIFIDTKVSTAKELGREILKKVGPAAQAKFGMSVQEVLVKTPTSKLEFKKTGAQRRTERKKVIREYKKEVEAHYNQKGEELVMQNRVSWSLFDKIRKEQGLTDRKRDSSGASLPQAK